MPSNAAQDTRTQRAYKACITCRKRKSRCLVASDGQKCQRCRREGKACVFPEQRYQRKSTGHGQSDGQHSGTPFVNTPDTEMYTSQADMASADPSPAGSHLAESVMRTVVSSGNDARDLLFSVVRDNDESHPAASGSTLAFQQCSMAHQARLRDNARTTMDAVEVWNACRWVMQGWLSAQEAIVLLDFFFEHISPLSPVLTDRFQLHQTHYSLVTDEPLLCCTILAIAARYKTLPGAGGQTRSSYIHDRLWVHIQHLLLRLVLGQEKQSKGKTRTLGSIEALLLLTEWQPRALAFPPPIDGWDSELMLHADQTGARLPKSTAERVRGRWAEDVVRPAKRVDQMSWMLLSNATALACELGVFDEPSATGRLTTPDTAAASPERGKRLRELLYIYFEQASLQLGCRSMAPSAIRHTTLSSMDCEDAQDSTHQLADRRTLTAWKELTVLSRSVADALLGPPLTTQQLSNGRYDTLINHFISCLAHWDEKFLSGSTVDCIPEQQTQLLRMEYLSLRVQISSIGMQALLSRGNEQTPLDFFPDIASATTNQDHSHVQSVIDGSIESLQLAVQLCEQQRLRFAPNRTLQRIVSASVFLLKGISLSVSSSKLDTALTAIRQTISVLRQSAVDDVQLGSRYADLLEMCLDGLQEKFVPYGQGSVSSSARASGPSNSTVDLEGSQLFATVADSEPTGDWDLDWLRLPVDPSSLVNDNSDAHGFSLLNDNSLDFLWDLEFDEGSVI